MVLVTQNWAEKPNQTGLLNTSGIGVDDGVVVVPIIVVGC